MVKYLVDIANDHPHLSKIQLEDLSHNCRKDRPLLKQVGLAGMEKMENWGIP